MADKKDEPAVVMLQPNKFFVGMIIISLVIFGYEMWTGGEKKDEPKVTGSEAAAQPTPAVPPSVEKPVPPPSGTGSAPPVAEKPEPPKSKLELFKKVEVEEVKWSGWVELPYDAINFD
ncbi:MAG: hypothetical protein AAB389_01040, partial [Patescibacteria group bacterium]